MKTGDMVKIKLTGERGMFLGEIYNDAREEWFYYIRLLDYSIHKFCGFELELEQ